VVVPGVIGHIIVNMIYDIIPTLGPACQQESMWHEMMDAGATVFRLNTSHLSFLQLEQWMEKLAPVVSQRQPAFPIVLDLQGSKWRLGEFTPLTLERRQKVHLRLEARSSALDILPVPHADFFRSVRREGVELVLNDGKQRLRVLEHSSSHITAEVMDGGEILPHKGITLADGEGRVEELSDKDRQIVNATREIPGIRYAISYLRDLEEMHKYRRMMGPSAYLIAKLERTTSMQDAPQIACIANEMWICRGDLGAEMGLPGMARAVYGLRRRMMDLCVPVMMAGQVLDHMQTQPIPTRSEVCYLHDCLMEGFKGFVLSDETAIGKYPLEACRAAALFRENEAFSE